ncbi:MAG: phosphate ABC transporter permease subunit PstC [Gemmataceae bacterium]
MSQPPPTQSSTVTTGDRLFSWFCQASGMFVLAVAASLVAVLGYQAWPALQQFGQLNILTSADWDPGHGAYGGLLFVYGTFATSALAMLVAVPLGVGAATYLSEIASPRIRVISSFLLELLAAIPSVIFGFWAVEFLAKRGLAPTYDLFGLKHQSGEGIVAAGLVLAVMVLPYITALSFDVCQAVPRSQREGSLSLGATRWQTIWNVVLPYAKPGIIAACVLALGRAIGETMAVTMVIGNAQHLEFSLTATGDSIPSIIAKQLHETTAGDDKRSVLIALGLVLLVITVVTNLLARGLLFWAMKPRVRSGKPLHLSATGELPPLTQQELDSARRRSQFWNRVMTWVLGLCQLLTVVPLFLILGYITYKGAGHVKAEFFTNLPNDRPPGLQHALIGSVTLVGLAAAFAIPVGITVAVLLSEYRKNRLVKPVRFVTDLLSGVPSIVIGVFGYAVLVSPFWLNPGEKSWGYSAWAGGFALAVMMLPVVIRSAEEAMRLVPNNLREASYALGASRRQTVLRVVIPAALPAIITGVLLAVGRIAGETAPLILTARGSQYAARSLSDATPSLPYYVYDFAKRPDEVLKNLAWAGAFVLVVVVLLLNISVRLLAGKRVVAAARAD